MRNEDVLGEEVHEDEQACIRGLVAEMLGQPAAMHGEPRFPGSQPVSLARANMNMLLQRKCAAFACRVSLPALAAVVGGQT
jgi:hypothetical protein